MPANSELGEKTSPFNVDSRTGIMEDIRNVLCYYWYFMCKIEDRSGHTHTHTHTHTYIYIYIPRRSSKLRKIVLNLVDFVAAVADNHASTFSMKVFHYIRYKYGDPEAERGYIRQILNSVYM